MPRLLKKNILFLTMFLVIVALSITIGVVANTNPNKNIEFKLGVQYEADLKIGVLIDNEYIFKSEMPIVHSQYIHSISGDIMKLNESALTFIDNKLTLTFENFHSDIVIQVIVNGDTNNPVTLDPNKCDIYEISKSSTGTTLINLSFEELQTRTITFNVTSTSVLEGFIVNWSVYSALENGTVLSSGSSGDYQSEFTYSVTFDYGTIVKFTWDAISDGTPMDAVGEKVEIIGASGMNWTGIEYFGYIYDNVTINCLLGTTMISPPSLS